MIICVAGYTASGKDTISDLLAKRLHLPRVRYTFKDLAREYGVDLLTFQRMASEDGGKIDREFDRRVIEEVHRLNEEHGGCIVSTWIAAWLIEDADYRVFLRASVETRARRVMKREGLDYESALRYITEKDNNNRERYLRYYNIDIHDLSIFDLIIDTDTRSPEEIVSIILKDLTEKLGPDIG